MEVLKTSNKLFLVIILFSFISSIGYALSTEIEKIQSVYIYHLINYINWPHKNKKIVCIVGKDLIKQNLTSIQNMSNSSDVKFELVEKNISSNFNECDVVYISTNFVSNFDIILDKIKGKHILSISGKDKFSNKGHIELRQEESKVRLVVNLRKVKESNINIPSKILKYSKIIN